MRAIKQKQYQAARRELSQSIRGPITDLAATLLSAWTLASPSEAKLAADSIDKLSGADWYAIFKDLHAGLILDLAGQKKEAGKRFERAYKARSDCAARDAGLWQPAVAPRQQGRGAQGIRGFR